MLDFYKKKEFTFSIFLIVVYVLLNNAATYLNNMVGTKTYLFQMIFNGILVAFMLIFILKNKLNEKYGLIKPQIKVNKYLFFIFVIILSTRNLWFGFKVSMDTNSIIIYLLSMLFVGICEELLFRGFLFKAIEKDGLWKAIIIVSLTFGLGHILHMFDANGVNVFENILQIIGAIFFGLVFVLLFLHTKSLIIPIIMHSTIDMLSAFVNDADITPTINIAFVIIGIVLCLAFSAILIKKTPLLKHRKYNY